MNAELRRLHSPDAPDLESFVPSRPAFRLLVQAIVGPADGEGEESFDFLVCSPAWLAERVHEGRYVLGRHHLVVERFDLQRIREVIVEICDRARGNSWAEVAGQIARHGKWEFEDYRG